MDNASKFCLRCRKNLAVIQAFGHCSSFLAATMGAREAADIVSPVVLSAIV